MTGISIFYLKCLGKTQAVSQMNITIIKFHIWKLIMRILNSLILWAVSKNSKSGRIPSAKYSNPLLS